MAVRYNNHDKQPNLVAWYKNRYKLRNLAARYNNRYKRHNLASRYNTWYKRQNLAARYKRQNFIYSWIRVQNALWLHVTVNALNRYNCKFINKLYSLYLKVFRLNSLKFQSGCFRVILPQFSIQSLVCANEQCYRVLTTLRLKNIFLL